MDQNKSLDIVDRLTHEESIEIVDGQFAYRFLGESVYRTPNYPDRTKCIWGVHKETTEACLLCIIEMLIVLAEAADDDIQDLFD